MSDVYSDFEQSIYDVLSYQFPSTGIVFSYDNGPEEVTPYIAIQVIQLDQIGREYIAGKTNADGSLQMIKHYEGFTSIKFIGDETKHLAAGDLAFDFEFFLDSPVIQEKLLQSNLSLMRKSPIRRIPMMRDTVWYMAYQLDVYFAFSVEARQDVDVIETTKTVNIFTKPNGDDPVIITQTIN